MSWLLWPESDIKKEDQFVIESKEDPIYNNTTESVLNTILTKLKEQDDKYDLLFRDINSKLQDWKELKEKRVNEELQSLNLNVLDICKGQNMIYKIYDMLSRGMNDKIDEIKHSLKDIQNYTTRNIHLNEDTITKLKEIEDILYEATFSIDKNDNKESFNKVFSAIQKLNYLQSTSDNTFEKEINNKLSYMMIDINNNYKIVMNKLNELNNKKCIISLENK